LGREIEAVQFLLILVIEGDDVGLDEMEVERREQKRFCKVREGQGKHRR
jgi:hypothetical protein